MITCEIPFLLPENESIFEFWKILNTFDRQPSFMGIGSISSRSIREFCFDYDLDWEMYELIMVFEKRFVSRYSKIQAEKGTKK